MRRVLRIGSVIVFVIAGVFGGRAVQGQEPQRQDMNAALLTEVRALRVAIEQMATASARVQLVMGRLQMQEQRVGDGVKRLDFARLQLSNAESVAAGHQSELQRLEAATPGADPAERTQLEGRRAQLKDAVSNALIQLQKARAEEADAAAIVAVEQARWTDINQQLDELDRVLRKPQ